MASGNDSATGIYGVSPYNYLTAQSPVDKQAPSSVLGGQGTNGSDQYEEDEPQPYNYLNPHAPPPFQRDGSVRPAQNTRRDPETGNVHAALNPTYDSNPDMAPGDGQFFPARREDNDYTNQYGSYQTTGNGGGNTNSVYASHQRENKYGAAAALNYSLKDGKLPRPQVSGGNGIPEKQDSFNNPKNDSFDHPPPSPYALKPRPLGSDAHLNDSYRNHDDHVHGGCTLMRVLGIILLAVLFLGVGFAAGWFASQYVNDDSSSDSVVASSTMDPMLSSASTAVDSTTMSPTTTTTTTTTTTPTTTTSPTTQDSVTVQ